MLDPCSESGRVVCKVCRAILDVVLYIYRGFQYEELPTVKTHLVILYFVLQIH